jgi:hypothetical protein
MEFLKKNFEKVALGVVLVVLLGVAGYLVYRVSHLNQEGTGVPLPQSSGRGEKVSPVSLVAYSNALQALQSPPQWIKNTQPVFPSGGESVIPTNLPPPPPSDLPFALLAIRREPFKLLFNACSYDTAKSEGYNFQVDFQFRPRTFFIPRVGGPVKDQYEDTGYKVTHYTHKIREEYNPTTGSTNVVDESELTVQRAGDEPAVMVLGQVGFAREPVAQIQCDNATRPSPIRRGQSFECKGVTYNVVDMSLTQMIVVEVATGKKHEINFTTTGAAEPGTRGKPSL